MTDTTDTTDTEHTDLPHPDDTTPDEAGHDPAVEGQIPSPTPDADADADMFPRTVVEKLRRESARYRERARTADTMAQRLHAELVRATGRLADPSDLPFDEAHLDDPDALAAAVDDLLDRKPHLASRRPSGDIGQGQRGPAAEGFSLLGLLKERT